MKRKILFKSMMDKSTHMKLHAYLRSQQNKSIGEK